MKPDGHDPACKRKMGYTQFGQLIRCDRCGNVVAIAEPPRRSLPSLWQRIRAAFMNGVAP